MAILTVSSDLVTTGAYQTTPKADGTLRCKVFTMPVPVQADIGSRLRLARLPQHAILLPNLSWIQCTAVVGLLVALGWDEYTDPATMLDVAASPTGLGTALTIAAGTAVLFSAFPAAPLPRLFVGDAVIEAVISGANITAGSVVAGCIAYAYYN